MRAWLLRVVGLCAAVAMIGAASGSARPAADQSCPIAGQCGVNAQTQCPTLGPLQPSSPQKCVPIPVSTFWVTGHASGGGCNVELIVQVEPAAGASQYEAVVYSNIGEGTRWWSEPVEPSTGTGPGAGPGQTISNDAATYTVPAGYYAWQVGGGSSAACTPPGMDWVGDGAWAVSTPAVAGGGTIHIKGPTKNVYHTHFGEIVYGTAHGGANYVISGEQLYPAGGCAKTYMAESAKSDWYQWPTGTGSIHGSFSLVARFYARNHKKHGICSYLVNRVTKNTYAYASRWWNNS